MPKYKGTYSFLIINILCCLQTTFLFPFESIDFRFTTTIKTGEPEKLLHGLTVDQVECSLNLGESKFPTFAILSAETMNTRGH